MLGQFPTPYPDELLYSVFARYYVRSGYSNYIFAAEDLFQQRNVRPIFEYFPAIKEDVLLLLTKDMLFNEVVLRHTMYPYHCRFLPQERKELAFDSLITMDNNYHDLILLPKRKTTPTMRYCPLCSNEDRIKYGETYWHRIHQIWELKICPIHHCNLINTAYKLSGKTSPDLISAEIVVTYNEKGTLCEDEKLCALADYVKEIFEFPMVLDKACSVAKVLQRKIDNTEYRSPRGEVCRITLLYNDFAEYYKGIIDDIPNQWKIHKLLIGQRFDFWEIVLLAFFLGIESSDLQEESKTNKFQYEVFDNQIAELHSEGLSYPQIANKMGLSLNTIKNAAYIKAKKAKPRKRRGGKPGRRPLDWESLDREMLPRVKETIAELKNSEKPQRITVGRVARIVGLKSKQIDKLSLCLDEIQRNCQTQEQFWAEKVLCAWTVLQHQEKVITIKQIRLQTNMSTEQIRRALPELKKINRAVYEELIKMM